MKPAGMKKGLLASLVFASVAIQGISPAQAVELKIEGKKVECPELDTLSKQEGFEQKYQSGEPDASGKAQAAARLCMQRILSPEEMQRSELLMKRKSDPDPALSDNPFNTKEEPFRNMNTAPWFRI